MPQPQMTGRTWTLRESRSFAINKAASSISLKSQTKAYTGKRLAYTGKVTKRGSKGSVSYKFYSNSACTKSAIPKNVGTYWVKATVAADNNHYSATSAAVKFTVNPKATSLKSLKAIPRGFKATWAKRAKQTSGYQLMYATNAKFTKGKKVVTISKPGTVSKKVAKLKAKKRYYVKVRTYKKVGGKTYYSTWSKVKTVKAGAKKSATRV